MSNSSSYNALPTAEASLVSTVAVEAKRLSVQVTAPSDLQEGFALNVQVDGKDAYVIVPAGGVQEGEQFIGPVEFLDGSTADVSGITGGDGIPVGHWRHGIFDCCMEGFFHPLWIMTLCYAALPLAQIQTRLQLNLWGTHDTSRSHGPSAFRVGIIIFVTWMVMVRGVQVAFWMLTPTGTPMTVKRVVEVESGHLVDNVALFQERFVIGMDVLVILFLVGASVRYQCFLDRPLHFRLLLGFLFLVTIGMDTFLLVDYLLVFPYASLVDLGDEMGVAKVDVVQVPGIARFMVVLHGILICGMRIFIVYAGTRTRSFLRQKYAIPGSDCSDCCWMLWCHCCTVIQMSTHTADYRRQPYRYGAENGLDDDMQTAAAFTQGARHQTNPSGIAMVSTSSPATEFL